ncbi:MAG: tetratricopeptide repeat protein, partial [Planctomycetes bacterium]|nr:tetratricopeptide repeat protein [Planctomycetota bacterium]
LVDSSTRSTDRACFMALRATLSNDDATRRAGLDAALELDPECGLAHFLRGEVLRARGESGPAFQSYLRAVNQTSAPPQAWPGLAETAMADHRPHIAQRALEVCARLEPGNARWHYNLGTVLLETDDNPKAARAAFERADALAPGDRDTLMNLATACVRAGDPEAARAVLERAQQLHPDDSDLVFNLAVLHVDHLNDPAGALELFRRYETMTGERSLRVERWIRELEARLQP